MDMVRLSIGQLFGRSLATRIDMVDPQMVQAFRNGVGNYVPVCDRNELEEESGVTEISYKNLVRLTSRFGSPLSIVAGTDGNCLVDFGHAGYYLATGLGFGYYGTGPYYTAKLIAYWSNVDEIEWYDLLAGKPKNYRGPLWQRSPGQKTSPGVADERDGPPADSGPPRNERAS